MDVPTMPLSAAITQLAAVQEVMFFHPGVSAESIGTMASLLSQLSIVQQSHSTQSTLDNYLGRV